MKPERGDGGVRRGMMGEELVPQGTSFDPERGRPLGQAAARAARVHFASNTSPTQTIPTSSYRSAAWAMAPQRPAMACRMSLRGQAVRGTSRPAPAASARAQ